MGAPICSEWFSRPGFLTPDHPPVVFTYQVDFVGLLKKSIINIETHLERLCALDLQQQCTSHSIADGELDIDQVRVATGDVVWQSLVSDTCIHFTELRNLRFKRYDFSAEGMKRRRITSLQLSRCISALEMLQKYTKILAQ